MGIIFRNGGSNIVGGEVGDGYILVYVINIIISIIIVISIFVVIYPICTTGGSSGNITLVSGIARVTIVV